MKKLYYILTGLFPRSLPRNTSDWDGLKLVLTRYFGLSDTPEVWATITSHVCSLPLRVPYTRVSYAYLAAVGKKLSVNEAANQEKAIHMKVLKEKFESKMKADAEQYVKDHPEALNAQNEQNEQASKANPNPN